MMEVVRIREEHQASYVPTMSACPGDTLALQNSHQKDRVCRWTHPSKVPSAGIDCTDFAWFTGWGSGRGSMEEGALLRTWGTGMCGGSDSRKRSHHFPEELSRSGQSLADRKGGVRGPATEQWGWRCSGATQELSWDLSVLPAIRRSVLAPGSWLLATHLFVRKPQDRS